MKPFFVYFEEIKSKINCFLDITIIALLYHINLAFQHVDEESSSARKVEKAILTALAYFTALKTLFQPIKTPPKTPKDTLSDFNRLSVVLV